nr:alpha/beta hydrolase-fold protein [Anaerolineae bacterium]
PQLSAQRDVTVWLPPDYESAPDRRYPVIYMHDGQNMFDPLTSYAGVDWRVDETMTALFAEGYSAVIVAVQNAGMGRTVEYSPYRFVPHSGEGMLDGRGGDYIRFLAETVKPLVDASFRTQPQAATTGLAGSSMGGLISLYGFLRRLDVFGLCGAFSPPYWFGGDALFDDIRQHATGVGRVYLDIGTAEGETLVGWGFDHLTDLDAAYVEGVQRIRDSLLAKGYREPSTLMYVEEPGADHVEVAWAARLPAAFRFLLDAH